MHAEKVFPEVVQSWHLIVSFFLILHLSRPNTLHLTYDGSYPINHNILQCSSS